MEKLNLSKLLHAFIFITVFSVGLLQARYEPTWESIDSRPIPSWYDESKFGIFLHWSVFSVPSFGSAWFWYFWKDAKIPSFVEFMEKNYRPKFTYAEFASQFTAELWDPYKWAEIFNASGAKYIVLTSKHIEGFTNWPSNYSFNWNSNATGPHRDLVGELEKAIRSTTNIRFGLYYCFAELTNPLYQQDMANNFTTNEYIRVKAKPERVELVKRYKPDLFWADGCWQAPDTYWESKEFIAWLYNDSPVKDHVVINDRWGKGDLCHHGGYFTCTDKYNPKKLQKYKFENCWTTDVTAWTYRRNLKLEDYHTIEQLIETLAQTISCNGNLLLNVGPTADGTIIPIFEERLRQMGKWLDVNGEAVYGTRPWGNASDSLMSKVWYTKKINAMGETVVYAIVLFWPTDVLLLGSPKGSVATTKVELVGYEGEFKWKTVEQGFFEITIPIIPFNKMPCEWAWVFRLTGLKNA